MSLLADYFQTAGTSFVSTNGGFSTSTNMSPLMSAWPMPEHIPSSHAGDTLSSSLNDSYLSYFMRSSALSNDVPQVGNLAPVSHRISVPASLRYDIFHYFIH